MEYNIGADVWFSQGGLDLKLKNYDTYSLSHVYKP